MKVNGVQKYQAPKRTCKYVTLQVKWDLCWLLKFLKTRFFCTDRWLTHGSNPRAAICLFPSSPSGKSTVYVDYFSETRLQWSLCAWPDSVVAASVNKATSIKRIFHLHGVTNGIFTITMFQCRFSLLEKKVRNEMKPIWLKRIHLL